MKLWKLICILIMLFPLPSYAQNAISISPNTGTSTLDNLKPTKGDTVELEFPSGFRCKIQSGDTPSFVFYGDQGNILGVTGNRFGLAFVVPLYSRKDKICDNSMKLQDALSVLEIADKLLQNGTLKNDEYNEITNNIKNIIMNIKP